ncbi:hypothetical protein [Azospirillum sp. sgz301742]
MSSNMVDAPIPIKRWNWWRIIKFASLGLVLLLATCTVVMLWEEKLPPLADNLSNFTGEANRQFNIRAQNHFPVGSSEGDMIRELSRQGFVPTWGGVGSSHMAVLKRSLFICLDQWFVSWRAEKGRITEIKGEFRPACL